MSTFYIDLDNGNDSSDGTTWGNAWKTITSGATAARIAPGDVIRISKTPDPTSIGDGTWTSVSSGAAPSTINISSSTNASPIEITTSGSHGLSTGDVVQIINHTTNTTANGAWSITYVSSTKFTLDGSVGVGVGGTSGTVQKVNWKVVKLATAQTKTIDRCEVAWTANGSGDCTVTLLGIGTECKEGGNAMKFVMDASVQTSTLQAYKTITSTDFSSYQKISFWIKNEAAIVANNWQIKLCSDTAGTTAVDTFDVTAIPSTGRWLPLTLTKSGGGNLGASIQSIALYSGSSNTGMASKYIYLDNIVGCTTSGLNLQSLISKNGSAQGGTEGYYGIQSISQDGKVLVLDNEPAAKPNSNVRGYYSTTASETVTTYKRETFKTAIGTATNSTINTINDSGTLGNYIEYQFGYEVGTTNQNGETFFDGLNGYGYSINIGTKHFIKLNYFSCVRYNYGIYALGNYLNIPNIGSITNNQGYGVYIVSSLNIYIDTAVSISNNGATNLYFQTGHGVINKIYNLNNSMAASGFANVYGGDLIIKDIDACCNNYNYGIEGQSDFKAVIYNLYTNYNRAAGGYIANTRNPSFLLKNASINESTEFNIDTSNVGWIYSLKHDGTDGNNWGWTHGATCNWQTGTVHSSEPGAWETAITSSNRHSEFKVLIPVCEVAGTANTAMTIKAWVKKDHATNIACRLVHYADSLLGTTEQAATKASDTDWEELSITVTPTSTNPVVKVWLETWYVAGNSNSYLGTITVT